MFDVSANTFMLTFSEFASLIHESHRTVDSKRNKTWFFILGLISNSKPKGWPIYDV